MKVGFIGLGIMGKPMAKNLVKAGHEVTVFDFKQASIDELVSVGAKAAKNNKEVAEKSDVIITMVPNSPNVEAALFGENGVAEGIEAGKTVIDMSSINPLASQKFEKKLKELGVGFLDAPVSGGEPKAIDGTIAIMVGGDEDLFNKFKDLLGVMGGTVTHCGSVGAGNTTKLTNQIIVALNIAAVSEGYALAKKAGLDPQKVFDAIHTGLAQSTIQDVKIPMILDRNFKPGFRIDLHIKDLQNALDTSHALNVSLPLTSEVMEILQVVKNDGNGSDDHDAIAKYYEKINDLKIER
ncbi:2-hydroxy-3-oxopropionate reductase [Ligilactobacillus salivarius]|uniref:2-hydroxy-3-oxopropionate reductase n=2 Tax=Ligilactobacillus salivarius TaxID=1624 RepID=A0A1Y0F5E6_9LACO|nr:2-hydroxy-3-oxopropionate reductase [Ligilactobacillus salivarius]ARU18530.1 2-hydroxy-3-oxopropionate reductase [Ligilactobacillus salivarius]MDU7057459.1 2-hydroxy-3-oxopropionate reductase [Ligilactobacillus salivarius]MYY52515.1 2-hydroxy-3-oxopropionate reductase [Ligilactobacillus salivarius]PAY54392.1 2-hydroxy-3-oxopropionate reductase [Ligilactobacillus salivarius]PAY60022.1 2-hydroxy-3-oxopropionate reductase [Ligilactobacillus salivarius]